MVRVAPALGVHGVNGSNCHDSEVTLTDQPSIKRAVSATAVAVMIGIVLGALLIVSRELIGGRPVGFWLENTGGAMLIAAFLAGLLGRHVAIGAIGGALALVIGTVLYDQVYLVTAGTFQITVFAQIRTVWLGLAVGFGALFGALGGWWAAERRRHWPGLAIAGGAVAGEALALLVGGLPHDAFRTEVAVVQIAIGIGGALIASPGSARVRATTGAVLVSLGVALVEAWTGVLSSLIW